MVAAGVLFLIKVEQNVDAFEQNVDAFEQNVDVFEQNVKGFPQDVKGFPQDVKVNLIIRGKEKVFCGRIS